MDSTDLRRTVATVAASILIASPGAGFVLVQPESVIDGLRVSLPNPAAAAVVRRALAEAARLLSEPGCRRLVDDYHDAEGRPLAQRLAALEVDLRTYLTLVHFHDGTGRGPCQDGLAFTAPGSRVVFVCSRNVIRAWSHNPRYLVATMIHELLHTLGLGENPPRSDDITTRVLQQCTEGRRVSPHAAGPRGITVLADADVLVLDLQEVGGRTSKLAELPAPRRR